MDKADQSAKNKLDALDFVRQLVKDLGINIAASEKIPTRDGIATEMGLILFDGTLDDNPGMLFRRLSRVLKGYNNKSFGDLTVKVHDQRDDNVWSKSIYIYVDAEYHGDPILGLTIDASYKIKNVARGEDKTRLDSVYLYVREEESRMDRYEIFELVGKTAKIDKSK